MAKHRDNRRYCQWSLERTASLLSSSLVDSRDSLVAVVRPARMERGTFSCFDNFVPSNSVGSPTHCDDHGALEQLSLILQHLQSPLSASICLIGFSKGVVVLNQLLRELSRQVSRGMLQLVMLPNNVRRVASSTSSRWFGWTEVTMVARTSG